MAKAGKSRAGTVRVISILRLYQKFILKSSLSVSALTGVAGKRLRLLRLFVLEIHFCGQTSLRRTLCIDPGYRKPRKLTKYIWLLFLAGVAGIEPAAFGFGDRRSSHLSYTPIVKRRNFLRLKYKANC